MRIGADDPEMGARIVDAYDQEIADAYARQIEKPSGSRGLFAILALVVMAGASFVIVGALAHLAYDLALFGWHIH